MGERKSLLAIGIIGLSLVLSVAFLANVVHAAASTSTTTTASSTNSTNSTSSAQPCTGLGTPQEDGDCQGTGEYGDQTGADTLAELPETEG